MEIMNDPYPLSSGEPNRTPLRVGTRGSPLARRQTDIAVATLRGVAPALPLEIRIVRTDGDRDQGSPLNAMGEVGVFTSALERALRRGDIDMAVHSLKDLPTTPQAGLILAAILPRHDARDALVSRRGALSELPPGARVGTSSPRRSAFLRALRHDLLVCDARGNIDARLAKLDAGEFDALVLAAAGLARLGLTDRVTQFFTLADMLPAPGQGALALQCRSDDPETLALARRIDDAPARAAALAERAFLNGMGAGCSLPVGAYAEVAGGELWLRAAVAQPGRSAVETPRFFRLSARGPLGDPEGLGLTLARRVAEAQQPLRGKRIVVTRAEEDAEALSTRLRAAGAEPVALPLIRIENTSNLKALGEASARWASYDWLVFTSPHGVAHFLADVALAGAAQPRIAAVGPATARALEAHGLRVDAIPAVFAAAHLPDAILAIQPDLLDARIAVIGPEEAGGPREEGMLVERLGRLGAEVDEVAAYRTLPAALGEADPTDWDAITFASGSAARALADLLEARHLPAHTRVVCIGPGTARAAQEAGFRVTAVAREPSLDGLVAALFDSFGPADDAGQEAST